MTDITQLILSKYYGFDADPKNKKFLSSHDGTYDPSNYCPKSYSGDTFGTETTEVASSHQGVSLETVKDETENSSPGDPVGNTIVRSSRAISDDDTVDDEESDVNEYEASVKSPDFRSERPPSEEKKHSDEKDLLVPKLERNDERDDEAIRNDSTLGHLDNIPPDNISEISSVPIMKKHKKKSPLAATSPKVLSLPPPPPRKLPACNGVFLDLTNLSLTEFPTNMLANIPNLRMLYLENNSLTSLPEQLFSSLKLLQWLDVRNNKLSKLPSNIKSHNCLETILLEGNLFEKLPLELCLLPNLKALQTSRNPLVFPPADILALGFAATINFLRSEWNKLHPEEVVESPERERKPKPSTILCSDPPNLRIISKSSRIFGSSSTGHVPEAARKISVRERGRNYRPSNRCENRGTDEQLEARLLWITTVKEMLTKQAATLQKVKDRDALNNWRRDQRSYEKSMSRAAKRNEDDIPYDIDLDDFGAIFKNRPRVTIRNDKSKNRRLAPPRNINEKMRELYESLSRLEEARKMEILTPQAEQKLLETEIKKITEMQEEIQYLRKYNVNTTAAFEGPELLPKTQPYERPPPLII